MILRMRMRAVPFDLMRRTGSWMVCIVLKSLISYITIFSFSAHQSKAEGGLLGGI